MKLHFSIFIILLLIFFNTACAQKRNSKDSSDACPPFHNEIQETLQNFLTGKTATGKQAKDKRQQWELNMQQVSYLKKGNNEMACTHLKEKFPWPVENHFRGYYKSKNYFFVVDALKQPPSTPKNRINLDTGYSIITILDKEFNTVGSISL